VGSTKPITDMSFEAEVTNNTGTVLVDFWAEWCGPCRALGPKLEEIASEMSNKVTVAKINVDENPNTAAKFGVRSIPTMIVFKNGKAVDQLVGNLPKDAIVEALTKHT
jgi:thioredoxin 1